MIIGVVMMSLLSAFGQDAETPTTAEGWYKRAYDKRHNTDLDGVPAQNRLNDPFGVPWRKQPEIVPSQRGRLAIRHVAGREKHVDIRRDARQERLKISDHLTAPVVGLIK